MASGPNPLLPSPLDELELSDEYIYELILKEAEEAKQRSERVGVLGYLSKYKEPSIRTNVPNKRFLKNMVQSTMSFNKNENERREREKNARYEQRDHHHRNTSRRSRSRSRSRKRSSRSRSRSGSRTRKKESSPSHKKRRHDENDMEQKSGEDTHPTDQVESLSVAAGGEVDSIGPKLPQIKENKFLLKTKPRGRGSIGSNRLDQYFASVNGEEQAESPDLQSLQASPEKEKKNKKEKKKKKDKKAKKHKT